MSKALNVIGDHAPNTISQMHDCMSHGNVVAGVLCADGHLGYAQPVGGVIAYKDQISVSGVGFDIGCGNMAVETQMPFHAIKDRLPGLLELIQQNISFGVGRTNNTKVDADLFACKELWQMCGMEQFRIKARDQLGTVGSGNHYVDLMVETTYLDDPEFGGSIEDCPVWIGVHFGSRGLGHTIATKFIKEAGGKDGINVPPALLAVRSDLGQQYLAGMKLAGAYAYAGREWVVGEVARIIMGKDYAPVQTVHNHHNYAWEEEHGGEKLWVVRKGATPAFPGQLGFVGGSMGDDAVILRGVESEASKASLYSTVHGAGRTMGRAAAKRTFARAEMDTWLKGRGVHVLGGDLDESPMAYRRLPDVLAHHKGTVEIVHSLRPVGVVMAGAKEFDPYKD